MNENQERKLSLHTLYALRKKYIIEECHKRGYRLIEDFEKGHNRGETGLASICLVLINEEGSDRAKMLDYIAEMLGLNVWKHPYDDFYIKHKRTHKRTFFIANEDFIPPPMNGIKLIEVDCYGD